MIVSTIIPVAFIMHHICNAQTNKVLKQRSDLLRIRSYRIAQN